MTTERALPIPPVQSPSPSKFSFPSPSKPDPNLKPNPHPYAVKTTTSALLSRSNSSGHNEATRHYYVPLSPNASRSPESAKNHKVSKSLNAVPESPDRSPRPLPVPPGSSSANTSPVHSADPSLSGYEADTSFPRRTKRADTLPTFPSNASSLEVLAIPEDLPPNPKLWTPSQLSTYLTTALRVTSQAKAGQQGAVPLPTRVAKDIATFTRSRMISGRMFLRLTEADLESMGMNKKWRELLLATSQELRQNVLKGRIWGPEVSPNPSPGSTSPLPNMFSNAFYNSNSSTSSLELSADEGAQAARPLPERPRRSRNGRVRGMVQSFERSGSFSSEASFDGDLEDGEDERAKLGQWLREEGGSSIDEQPFKSPSPTRRPLPDPFAPAPQRATTSTPPPQAPAINEEPSMEELLAAEPGESASAWGARAWEEMDNLPGVTVKRMNGVPHPLPPLPSDAEVHRTVVGHGRDASSGRRKERDERRVVTAIFTPSVPADEVLVVEPPTEELKAEVEPYEAAVQTDEHAAADATAPDAEARRLSEGVAATRALVDVFRKRLEDVEAKVAELERLEVEREERERQLAAERAAQEAVEVLVSPGVEADRKASSAEDPASSTLLGRTTSMLPAALQHLDLTGSFTGANGRTNEDDGEPSRLSELPSYVLLVGFGVCAVVLRVVLRRVAGRNAIAAWKT
ncbi:uncharacterized protein C8Q71DRAFT_544656 [Rhodofomes roseus]|uniref:SAM domain-containing protein n=1 Tax=Rhodofomes roseus TaxID=34475 RepID=A0ABQ8KLB8_9APHY|nr:uncharacterized protein C8Q71DRAFT_544656 [Rhodofomes roseus]KAH9838738.1 hypothetical protein C8Q71DRAFT_544656 [Rhodofomes roseus]